MLNNNHRFKRKKDMEKEFKKVISKRDRKEYYVVICTTNAHNGELIVGKRYQVRKGENGNVIVNGTFWRKEDYEFYNPFCLNGYNGTSCFNIEISNEVAEKSFTYITK